jgi:hypothetical protein
MSVQEVEMREVPNMVLNEMLKRAGVLNSDAMGDACGGGCGRGANCHTRSEEMEAMVCGAD